MFALLSKCHTYDIILTFCYLWSLQFGWSRWFTKRDIQIYLLRKFILLHMYTEILRIPCLTLIWNRAKSGSGAPGPEDASRGTKSTIFAKGILSSSNFQKLQWINQSIICNSNIPQNPTPNFLIKLQLGPIGKLMLTFRWAHGNPMDQKGNKTIGV